ncbi:MAG: ribose 5-phosphate isomerase B [Acutalibacteraceae bacterium]|nr:ribose 5-phosphate isomerase B [Acutalibacteraceae bacterium]
MIALAADHGGFELKEAIKNHLISQGVEVKDFGTYSNESVDYPIYAEKAARSVANKECTLGIICCGTGIGVSMVANKIKGIRAAVVTNDFCAEMTRRHNDANILCMGGRVINEETAIRLTDIFLNTPFEGGRHINRVCMIKDIEEKERS